MDSEIFQNISKIIERDSKVTTYKFALLRGVIDIIQDNSPYLAFSNGRVIIPTGLIIERWLLYYYPILSSSINIPQINGELNLAFILQFEKLIFYYKNRGGYSTFYNDLKNKGIPIELQSDFYDLCKKVGDTIIGMPMRYIGRSLSDDFYSIFNIESRRNRRKSSAIDIEYLISNFGTFSIPKDYYEAFQVIGSFISGQDSLLFKWAEFSVNASGKSLSIESVVNEVLKHPITERDISESKNIYRSLLRKEGKVFCVWTGNKISKYDVDHMIPFAVWKNNDLWNLLPSKPSINNQKRDKIPSPQLIGKRKDLIFHYWNLINEYKPDRFKKELQVTLLGNHSFDAWHDTAINQLVNSCKYLIANRGFDEWDIIN